MKLNFKKGERLISVIKENTFFQTIQKLFNLILERKNNLQTGSYTSSLFCDGRDRIIQKVGEEAVEVIIAAKNNNKKEFIGEISDLIYHLLVLLVEKGVSLENVGKELEKRGK